MEAVVTQDRQELERLEGIIRENIGAFYEIGDALTKIRVNKYYHKVLRFETFEEYCKARWDFKRAHAYRLIDSAKVIDVLSPIGDIKSVTESQVRPLTRLAADQQLIAWQKAVETAPDGKVTAALVYKIVKNMLPQPPPKPKFVSPPSTPESPSTGDANYFTNMAIYQLERIRDDDPLRDAAFCRLKEWMEKWIENHKPGRKLK